MKTLAILVICCYQFHSFSQNIEDEFTIGIQQSINTMLTNHAQSATNMTYDCYDRETYTETHYLGNPSSTLNVFVEDGFNTVMPFSPAIWSFSDYRIKTFLELSKKLNLKILPFTASWYVPLTSVHDGNGINVYNNDLSGSPWFLNNSPGYQDPLQNCKARANYEYLFNNVYNDINLKNVVKGYHLGGEFNFNHLFNSGVQGAGFAPNEMFDREVPPARVNDATAWFNSHKVGNQKTYISYVNHGASMHLNTVDSEWNITVGDFQNTPVDYDHGPYFTNNNLPDVAIEESYHQWDNSTWLLQPYTNISNNGPCNNNSTCNKHYLAKYKNIDFLQQSFKEVNATFTIETVAGGTNYLDKHYNSTSKDNANFFWFQIYTSIIHGVDGIFIYGIDDYRLNEQSKRDVLGSIQLDRYSRQYRSDLYNRFAANIAKELRYLSNNGFLTPSNDVVLFEKTDNQDKHCIVPNATTYIPSNLPSEKRTENYGLRYTIRINENNEIIMIVSNPLNIAITTTLDFSTILTPGIKQSTGVNVLFEANGNVNLSNYKVDRNSNINLTGNSIGTQYYKSFVNDKKLSLTFGPLDVHVLKFVNNSQQAPDTDWIKVWSNNGSGNIGGWTINQQDKFYTGDFDGDNDEDVLCVQTGLNRNFVTLLTYENGEWVWKWSNNNNSNHPIMPFRDNLYVGDFNGDGKDELLGNDLDGWITCFEYNNSDFVWGWSDYGNHTMTAYKDKFEIGDFDGDGKDEVLGIDLPNGYTTMFNYENNTFNWGWSDNGNSAEVLRQYRAHRLIIGDADGDGKDEIIGINSQGSKLFNFDNNLFTSNWTFNGSNLGNWSLPISGDDIFMANIDYNTDIKKELMLIDNSSISNSLKFNSTTNSWEVFWASNQGVDPVPYINDWPIDEESNEETRYYPIRLQNNGVDYILAMRRKTGCLDNWIACIYRKKVKSKPVIPPVEGKSINMATNESKDLLWNIFPNPTENIVNIELLGLDDEIVEIEVMDSYGRLLIQKSFRSNEKITFDMSNYSRGNYHFILKTKTNINHKNVILK